MRIIVVLFFLSGFILYGCAPKINKDRENHLMAKNQSIPETQVAEAVIPVTPKRGEVLFLGHKSKHHDSYKYAPWLAIKLFKSGVNLTYTDDLNDLNKNNLSKYDGLIIYANHDSISIAQETALRDFVQSGKGLIPLHSAAGCFKNSEWYIKTIGGQFASHGEGDFKGTIVKADHPVMNGITAFSTWDETYTHKNINPDMTVLMERVEGNTREPYTWVRNEGKGRVFYTAYGHEDRTWTNLGFLDLVRNGVLWAIGDAVNTQIKALNIPDVDIYNSDTIAKFTDRHLVPKMQPALSAGESNKLTQVPVDFDIKLFASEPNITNPIAMAWDERGRLWIVESVDYPNTFVETDGASNDRIKICEDTDGDGVADKFTVFADSLNIPTSIVFANGGVIVSMAPHFVFLKDTDGDDVADVKEIIMTGWGKGDTHAGPSNLTYGFDNRIWGVTGYSGFNGKVNGKRQILPQGVYSLKPNGEDFQFHATTSNNTWGFGFSEDNNAFISTANNTHSAYYSMPESLLQRRLPESPDLSSIQAVQQLDGHYDAHAMTPNLRQVDVVGGFTSAAGHRLYTARNFPKEYWNRMAFVTEPTVRLVHNAIIEPNGAGFAEKDGWNLMASSDEWFGPVQAEVGPDGAVWVADWYNFIIQHNVFVPAQAPAEMVLPFTEQPHGQGNAFESPLRDINHGRIYRVVYKNAKPNAALKLSKNDIPGLLAALENDNLFWRMTAQRLLVELKNKSVLPALFDIINNQKVDEIGLNGPAINALWTLHGLGALDGSNPKALQVVEKAMKHPSAGVRKAAVQVMPKNQQGIKAIQNNGLMNDPNLNTRLATFVSLASLPASAEIGEMIYQASLNKENELDKWLAPALYAAAVTHEAGFLNAIKTQPAALSSPSMQFTQKIVTALEKEVYTLRRRSILQFSPDVSGKEIIIKASIAQNGSKKSEGLILAQGDKKNGYGLFMQDGKLKMQVNQKGKSYVATTNKPLPEKFDVLARLTKNGNMSIEINGASAAKAKAPGLFSEQLVINARSGRDIEEEMTNGEDNTIGKYTGRFEFTGNLQNLSLELVRPVKEETASQDKKPVAKTETAVNPKEIKATTIILKVVKDVMQYDKKLLTVKAGQKVTLIFENPDGMPHNLLIIKPGTLNKVGEAADALLRDPKAAEMQYVPKIPEVLHATKLLNPGDSETLQFTVPDQPGDYPFVCTFPGHWRGMNGILRVVR